MVDADNFNVNITNNVSLVKLTGKHFFLNLLEKKEPIVFSSLKRNRAYRLFEFEDILQYVTVPHSAFGTPNPCGGGRTEVVELFNWLEIKNVKTMVYVQVQDSQTTAHTDQAIVESLSRFNVEILDWRKADLCPLTIREACTGKLRVLHLCWTGGNAILVAWGGLEGLANLSHLTDVYLDLKTVG